jgi:hypothetical protein
MLALGSVDDFVEVQFRELSFNQVAEFYCIALVVLAADNQLFRHGLDHKTAAHRVSHMTLLRSKCCTIGLISIVLPGL